MKLPNGYGNVSKLPGNRRNPWRARKTKEWIIDETAGTAKQVYVTVGYYPTRKAALEALAAFNQNPYDIGSDKMTFAELYEKWSEEHFEEIVPSARRTWSSAYNHSKPLWDMRMKDIKAAHLEGAIHSAHVGQSTKSRMKSLYNQMYRYAMRHEIVDKNYAELCKAQPAAKPTIVREPFSNAEIETLWLNQDVPYVNMVLLGIYSGWRPQELCVLKTTDIDIEQGTMFGGLKTDAGKNRIVPIHPLVHELVADQLRRAAEEGSETLFFDAEKHVPMTYDRYRRRWDKLKVRFNMSHRPHDTRHTFITLAKEAGMDEYMLKLMVGHEVRDITERIYTHRTIEQLKKEIAKIQ